MKNSRRQDWIIAAGLLILGLITRIPFACRMIFHSDSARFALAMEHFDVGQMRPHAPGYILYVASAKLADLFIHNARASLISVNVLSSALTVVFLYFLALKMYGRTKAVISSLLLASSPLFWFNGEMPFTYALEGLFGVMFAYSCYQMIVGEKRWLIASAVLLGIATGVRQNIIILFFPLWLYALRKYSFKQMLSSLFVFGMTCFAWFVPIVELSGGLKNYFAALHAQFSTVVLNPAPFLFEVKVRGIILAKFIVYSLALGIAPVAYYFGQLFRIPFIIKDIRLQFMLFWVVPAVIFYLGVTLWNPGQVIIILPPLFILLAESLRGLAKDLEEGFKLIIGKRSSNFLNFLKSSFSYKILLVSSVILILSINVFLFLFLDTQVSYAAIKYEDEHLAELIRLTREISAPEKTIILACRLNTQAGYYLPEYLIYCPFPLIFSESDVPIEAQNVYISFQHQTTPKTYWIPSGFRIEPILMPDGVDTIIVWEKEIAQYYQDSNRPLGEITSKLNEAKVFFLKLRPEEKICYGYHNWIVK